MDRLRKALDSARAARACNEEGPPRIEPAGPHVYPRASNTGSLPAIVYSRTKTFRPSARLLEQNRVTNPAVEAPAVAAYRMLRTQVLQRMDARAWRSLAVFSPGAHDGKTTTAINLAVSAASDHSHTVLLVDFDLRRPMIAATLGLQPQFGVEDVLMGRASLEECLYHPEGFERLVVLPALSATRGSSEILAAPRAKELMVELRSRYPERIVIFDLPPVLLADDALAVAPRVDCGLVVAAEGRTRRNDLVRTIELLHQTPLVGTVLNRAADARSDY